MRRRPTFNPLSFEKWQEKMLADASICPTHVDCLECNGSSFTECCECGHERECEDCDGTGRMLWSGLTDAQRARYLTRNRYAEAVCDDALAWGRWLNREPAADLISIGLRCWTDVRSRKLRASVDGQGGLH